MKPASAASARRKSKRSSIRRARSCNNRRGNRLVAGIERRWYQSFVQQRNLVFEFGRESEGTHFHDPARPRRKVESSAATSSAPPGTGRKATRASMSICSKLLPEFRRECRPPSTDARPGKERTFRAPGRRETPSSPNAAASGPGLTASVSTSVRTLAKKPAPSLKPTTATAMLAAAAMPPPPIAPAARFELPLGFMPFEHALPATLGGLLRGHCPQGRGNAAAFGGTVLCLTACHRISFRRSSPAAPAPADAPAAGANRSRRRLWARAQLRFGKTAGAIHHFGDFPCACIPPRRAAIRPRGP